MNKKRQMSSALSVDVMVTFLEQRVHDGDVDLILNIAKGVLWKNALFNNTTCYDLFLRLFATGNPTIHEKWLMKVDTRTNTALKCLLTILVYYGLLHMNGYVGVHPSTALRCGNMEMAIFYASLHRQRLKANGTLYIMETRRVLDNAANDSVLVSSAQMIPFLMGPMRKYELPDDVCWFIYSKVKEMNRMQFQL